MDYRDPDWIAERLGLDRNTVYKFLHDGTIPAVQLGRKWLVSEKRLYEWLEQETQRQTQARQEATKSTERTVRRMDSFAPDAQEAIRAAHTMARGYCHTYLGQEHLLLALASAGQSPAGQVLGRLGLSGEVVRQVVEQRVQPGEGGKASPRRLGRTDRAKHAMRLAARRARERGEELVNAMDLLMGIACSGEGIGYEILQERGITPEVLEKSNTNTETIQGVDHVREQ
jgi:excisionase family DNA binding protein